MTSTASICLFCKSIHEDESVEHIVPRRLGNVHYILSKGVVCAKCNNKFGLIEQRILSSKLFLEERIRLGLLDENHPEKGGKLEDRDLVNFLLKMAYESLYKSRRDIWIKCDFTKLLEHLMHGKKVSLFYEKPSRQNLNFKPVPKWIDRFRLANNFIRLEYAESGTHLYFQFQFGNLVSAVQLT